MHFVRLLYVSIIAKTTDFIYLFVHDQHFFCCSVGCVVEIYPNLTYVHNTLILLPKQILILMKMTTIFELLFFCSAFNKIDFPRAEIFRSPHVSGRILTVLRVLNVIVIAKISQHSLTRL